MVEFYGHFKYMSLNEQFIVYKGHYIITKWLIMTNNSYNYHSDSKLLAWTFKMAANNVQNGAKIAYFH